MDLKQNLSSSNSFQHISNKNNLVRINLLNFIKEELNNRSNNKTSFVFSSEKFIIIIENIKTKNDSNESNHPKAPKVAQSDSSDMSEDEGEISSSDMSAVEEIKI